MIDTYLPYELGKLQESINNDGFVHGNRVSHVMHACKRHNARQLRSSYCFVQITYADFAVHLLMEMVERVYPEVQAMEKYPELAEHYKKVAAIPSIAKWMKARPETVL